VHHGIYLDLVGPALPAVIPLCCFIMILTMYSIIRLHDRIHPLQTVVLSMILIFSSIILRLVVEGSACITQNSLLNSKLGGGNGRSSYEKANSLSNRPLKFNIGQCFYLSRDTFLLILHSVVITNTVNLLVSINN